MSETRRGFLAFLGAGLVAALAIVRAASLMPVKAIVLPPTDAIEAYELGARVDWARGVVRLIEFRNEITREFIRANLFSPYMPFPTPDADARRLSAQSSLTDNRARRTVCAVRGESVQASKSRPRR